MKNEWNKWKIVVFSVVAVAFMLSVSYLTFAQPLAYDAPKDSRGIWDIGFVDAEEVYTVGGAKELSGVSFTKTYATFDVYIGEKGDQLAYDFTIKNSGKLDAILESIYIVPMNKYNDAIFFNISGLTAGSTLKVGESKKLRVVARYNPYYNGNVKVQKKNVKIILNYVQKRK